MSKRDEAWVLHVKSAYAVTDTPDQVRVDPSWNDLGDLMFLSGSRIRLATSQMSQWVVLRCDTQHSQVSLHISVFGQLRAQILASRRTRLPDLPPDFLLIRPPTFSVYLIKFGFAF